MIQLNRALWYEGKNHQLLWTTYRVIVLCYISLSSNRSTFFGSPYVTPVRFNLFTYIAMFPPNSFLVYLFLASVFFRFDFPTLIFHRFTFVSTVDAGVRVVWLFGTDVFSFILLTSFFWVLFLS